MRLIGMQSTSEGEVLKGLQLHCANIQRENENEKTTRRVQKNVERGNFFIALLYDGVKCKELSFHWIIYDEQKNFRAIENQVWFYVDCRGFCLIFLSRILCNLQFNHTSIETKVLLIKTSMFQKHVTKVQLKPVKVGKESKALSYKSDSNSYQSTYTL